MFLSRKYAAKLAAVHRMRFIEHVAVTTLNLDRRARTHVAAREPQRLPVVLSVDEIVSFLEAVLE